MEGNGVPANESVLIFAQHEGHAYDGSNGLGTGDPPDKSSGCETEFVVFEVPAREADAWLATDMNQRHEPDTKRFEQMLGRVKSGSATLAAHAVLASQKGQRATARMSDEVMTATEFDGPDEESPGRMRPTALETLPVGCEWQVEVDHDPALPAKEASIVLNQEFRLSTARPLEPSLKASLAIAATGSHDYPQAPHPSETWRFGDGLKLIQGQVRCLGTRKPPGVSRDVLHVAFVRVRILP